MLGVFVSEGLFLSFAEMILILQLKIKMKENSVDYIQ